MTTSYYDRQAAVHLDGTPIFKTADDERNETEVATQLEQKWGCNLRAFGKLSPIDWYAEKNGRVVGLLELKSRTHASTTYPTVFFNLRKWAGLMLASVATGVPALYVVRFTDSVRWVKVADVDARELQIAGCTHIVKARSDVEPVILVPVNQMVEL